MSTKKPQSFPAPLVKTRTGATLGAVATGSIMGICLCKSQVFRPDLIQAQMLVENFTMLKMFLSAAVVSTITIQFMNHQKWIHIVHQPVQWAKNIAGGALIGIAMYITGSCPGTVLAQLGMGIKSAQTTMIGGIAGAFVYGWFYSSISKLFAPPAASSPPSVDGVLKISKTVTTTVLLGGFAAVLSLLEYIRPWQVDVGVPLSVSALGAGLFSPVWSPYFGGAIIGLLQIPNYLMMNSGLGCSSGYVSLISNVLGENFSKQKDYFKGFYGTVSSIWKLFLDVGIVVGSGVCLYSLGAKSAAPAFSTLTSLAGGFLLIFGARLADGCTSGHGLTGIGIQNFGSLLSVISMFGAGIATAFIAKQL